MYIIEAFQTTVAGPMNANIAWIKFGNLSNLDVCSPTFVARNDIADDGHFQQYVYVVWIFAVVASSQL